jgi:alpha-glucosidase
MQRYAGLWTGDSPSSRNYLVTLIPQTLNLGLSGVVISGSDVGGFAPGDDSIPRNDWPRVTHYVVLVRWVQISAFLSWFRNHYGAYSKEFQEVYKYGEPVPTYCRQIIELRYRLIPVLYSAMYEWTQSGKPICRPLFINDPQDLNVYDHVDDQFFVGDDLLVAPIVPALDNSGLNETASREVYLPAGSFWYAFKDNRAPLEAPVPGGTLLADKTAWVASLDQVPLYIRDGAILPMRNSAEQYVGELSQNPLVFNAYPGSDRVRHVYLDDGITLDAAERDHYRLCEVSQTTVGGRRQVRIRRVFDQYTPPEPFYFVAFLGSGRPVSVKINDAVLPDAGGRTNLDGSGINAYSWDAGSETTYVKVIDTVPNAVIEVS